MRTALLALLALGCGTSTPDPINTAACGDLPDGQVWVQAPGCTPVCVVSTPGNYPIICAVDGGPSVCSSLTDDPHNCGQCGIDCERGACRPVAGMRYAATCRNSLCVCRQL